MNFRVRYLRWPDIIKQTFSFKHSHFFHPISFNTAIPTQGFIYANQFLQMSSTLPSSNIYGLGEHVMGLRINTTWTRLSLFSRDIATPEVRYLSNNICWLSETKVNNAWEWHYLHCKIWHNDNIFVHSRAVSTCMAYTLFTWALKMMGMLMVFSSRTATQWVS